MTTHSPRKTELISWTSFLEELQSLYPSVPLHKPDLHQFTVVRKMGYPDGVRCWCGESLELKLHEPGQDAKRRAFFDAHEECAPAEVQ